jgi:DNA modification methylase
VTHDVARMTDPYYQDDQVKVHKGDCLNVLAELSDTSVDSVVTDPPYGLNFMGSIGTRALSHSTRQCGDIACDY